MHLRLKGLRALSLSVLDIGEPFAVSGLRRVSVVLGYYDRGWLVFSCRSIFEPGRPLRVNA